MKTADRDAPKKGCKNMLLRDVPEDLWKQLKVRAVKENVPMKHLIVRLLKEAAAA